MKRAILTTIALVLILCLLSSCSPISTPSVPDKYSGMSFEELKKEASSPGYDDLFRNNQQYIGELVYYQAEVIQVLEVRKDTYQLRGNITKKEYHWDDTVFLHYFGTRLLDDDIIEFVGVVEGLITYKSILGAEITIPNIKIIEARIITKAGER